MLCAGIAKVMWDFSPGSVLDWMALAPAHVGKLLVHVSQIRSCVCWRFRRYGKNCVFEWLQNYSLQKVKRNIMGKFNRSFPKKISQGVSRVTLKVWNFWCRKLDGIFGVRSGAVGGNKLMSLGKKSHGEQGYQRKYSHYRVSKALYQYSPPFIVPPLIKHSTSSDNTLNLLDSLPFVQTDHRVTWPPLIPIEINLQ